MAMTQGRVAQIINKANFCEINNLLDQGHNMEYIAAHFQMDLPLAWALRLQGKTDQEKFKELGWGLRTWDQWNFNDCDERFGDDWPGRIRGDQHGKQAESSSPDKNTTNLKTQYFIAQ